MDFTNKTVLVTGGSRGIGAEIARQFAEHGATVAVHYRANGHEADKTLASLHGTGHITVQADMTDAGQIQRMMDQVVTALGKLDVLVNNAGIFEEIDVAALDFDVWQDHWERTLNTNLVGPANATLFAARHMIPAGGGRIVNVSSRGAFRGEPTAPAYGASKAGLNAMGQSMAVALAPYNVFIGTVAPGFVETDMTAHVLESERGDAIRAQSPLGRVAKPEEVAYTVLFLAAEQTAFLTGCVVDVNGASYLRT